MMFESDIDAKRQKQCQRWESERSHCNIDVSRKYQKKQFRNYHCVSGKKKLLPDLVNEWVRGYFRHNVRNFDIFAGNFEHYCRPPVRHFSVSDALGEILETLPALYVK